MKSPARRTCGKRPLGFARYGMTLASLTWFFSVESKLHLDARAQRQRRHADGGARGQPAGTLQPLLPGGVDRRKLLESRREDARGDEALAAQAQLGQRGREVGQ